MFSRHLPPCHTLSPTPVAPRRLASLAFLLVLAGSLGAQTVVYDNLVTSGNSVQTWANITKVGQSFTPNASGTLSSITLNLTMSSTVTPIYSVELWSDDGGATPLPSSLLATFVTGQPWSSVYSGTPGTYNAANTVTFSSGSFGQNYSVNAGTPYWLVVTSTSGAAKAWGIGAASDDFTAVFSNATTSWGSTNLTGGGSLGAQITVSGSAIPEPSTYAAIAGAACLVAAGYSRRRKGQF